MINRKQSNLLRETDPYKRVILHIDLDCFYAQVEHNRLKVPLSVPLAVQQWSGLIAVNYASRDFGVKRHTPVAEALLKCPQLRLVHVPTYSVESVGSSSEIIAIPQYHDEMPAFRSDGTRMPPNPPDPASNKACLEPYRQASMAIFRLIRDWCSSFGDGVLVEKGGLDEAFIDITEEVEQQLIDEFDQKYTMLRDELAELDEADQAELETIENLKLYDTSWIKDGLNYDGLGETALAGQEDDEALIVENVRKCLGKLRIWKGAQLAKQLRQRLRLELNFIASIGIASNKMLAKLVSAHYKPDKQTRIDPSAVESFMKLVPFEKIRMMGGKMGKNVLRSSEINETTADYNDDNNSDSSDNDDEYTVDTAITSETSTVMASDLWPLTVSELTGRVGDRQTAIWIYQLIRGLDPSPVTPRSLTKSFMSAKAFRPAVRDWPELHDWVVVLVGELWSRMAEEKENSGRWPATITAQFKSYQPNTTTTKSNPSSIWANSGALSKSCEFPYASSIPSQATLSDFLSAVFKIFSGISSLFPIRFLSISVTNFKGLEADGKARATRVDQFFKKKSMEGVREGGGDIDGSVGLERFFKQIKPTAPVAEPQKQQTTRKKSVFDLLVSSAKVRNESTKRAKAQKPCDSDASGILKFFKNNQTTTDTTDTNSDTTSFKCSEPRCHFSCQINDTKLIQEHSDHHYAMKLSRE